MQTHIHTTQTHFHTSKREQTHVDTIIGDERASSALCILGADPEIEKRNTTGG